MKLWFCVSLEFIRSWNCSNNGCFSNWKKTTTKNKHGVLLIHKVIHLPELNTWKFSSLSHTMPLWQWLTTAKKSLKSVDAKFISCLSYCRTHRAGCMMFTNPYLNSWLVYELIVVQISFIHNYWIYKSFETNWFKITIIAILIMDTDSW